MQPANGLHIAQVAWPSAYVALIGCLLSSSGAALQCLVGAPRLIEAVSRDRVLPILSFLVPSGNNPKSVPTPGREPIRALLLTYFLAQIAVLVGSLDAVASWVIFLDCFVLAESYFEGDAFVSALLCIAEWSLRLAKRFCLSTLASIISLLSSTDCMCWNVDLSHVYVCHALVGWIDCMCNCNCLGRICCMGWRSGFFLDSIISQSF